MYYCCRSAYRLTVETSVYVRNGFHGMGIGYKLYDSLICDLKSRGFHTAIAIMAAPNEASSRLVFHLIFNLYHDFYNHILT